MHSNVTLVLALGLASFSTVAAPTGNDTASNDAKIDAMVKSLTVAPARTLGKASAFCSANHQPAGKPLDERLAAYVAAMSSGTREAMLEIAKTDAGYLQSGPAYSLKDFEMMDQQADMLLKQVQASPAGVCAKLGETLDAGSSSFFKEETLRSYQQFQARRAQYCAHSPKPANCR